MKAKTRYAFILAILLLAFPHGTAAQTPLAILSVGSGSGLPGATNVSVPVSLTAQDGAQVIGLNFDLGFDVSQLAVGGVTIGSAASSAGKSLAWSQPASGRIRVIIFGVNETAISDGPVAVVSFNVLAGAAPGTSTLTLSNAVAAGPGASPVPVSLSNGSFTVLSPPDTNTPVITSTPTPTPTSTLTGTPTSIATATSSAPTATSAGPSPTSSSTSTRTRTPTPTTTPFSGATTTSAPGNTPTGASTSTATATGGTTGTPGHTPGPSGEPVEPSTTMTPAPEGEYPADLEVAAAATGTALAEFEAAVVATTTALATPGQESVAGVEAVSGPSSWLRQWRDVFLLGGAALGATLLVAGVLSIVWGRKVSDEEQKRIH